MFRPYPGFRGIRTAPRRDGGKDHVIAFADFATPADAADALAALRGYVFDLERPDAHALRFQYARAQAAGRGRR